MIKSNRSWSAAHRARFMATMRARMKKIRKDKEQIPASAAREIVQAHWGPNNPMVQQLRQERAKLLVRLGNLDRAIKALSELDEGK